MDAIGAILIIFSLVYLIWWIKTIYKQVTAVAFWLIEFLLAIACIFIIWKVLTENNQEDWVLQIQKNLPISEANKLFEDVKKKITTTSSKDESLFE